MEGLTESEIAKIAKLQRENGLERLSSFFSWSEFCDERQRFHQEFVYDAAMFAVASGFRWPDVIQAAVVARDIFPQLSTGLDVPKLFSLLLEALSDCLPNLNPLHRHDLTQYLTHTCITRRKLLQAAVSGASNARSLQVQMDMHVPPNPCPLQQGTEVAKWERQQNFNKVNVALQLKEDELKSLRLKRRVTLGEVDVPEDEPLDKEGVVEMVRAALKTTETQMRSSLDQEAQLLGDILQLKLQQTAFASNKVHGPAPSATVHGDSSEKAKMHSSRHKAGSRKHTAIQ